MTVIDVHTHMLNHEYLEFLQKHGSDYEVKETKAGEPSIWKYGAPFMTLREGMWDYPMRIREMDKAGVDIAIVTLTAPNCYFGDAQISLKAAQIVNDDMVAQQKAYPDRIRWMVSLPWQHEALALQELERGMKAGAVGVMVLANIAGTPLDDARYEPIWTAIEKADLPVLIHPTAPIGVEGMGLDQFGVVPSVGFTYDTALAVVRLIQSGFLDRHPNLKLIASHGGGTLPYLCGRLDKCYHNIPAAREFAKHPPSEYLRRIYYDTVVFTQGALELCIEVAGSAEQVLYGSDYPHNIGDMVHTLRQVNALPVAQQKLVRGENARRIFKL